MSEKHNYSDVEFEALLGNYDYNFKKGDLVKVEFVVTIQTVQSLISAQKHLLMFQQKKLFKISLNL